MLKIFIENIDSYLGRHLVEELRNDHENDVNPHQIYGNGNSLPRGQSELISLELENFAKLALQSDILIFSEQVHLAEFAFKLLKHAECGPKTLIFVSSYLTWSSTPNKEKQEEGQSNRVSQLESDPEMVFLKKYSRYTEQDLHLRKIYNYEAAKHLEQLIITCEKPSLKAYIICAGMLYGNGEDQLFDYFKSSWMNPEQPIPIYGEGQNVIPMIHVVDLATIIGSISRQPPEEKYIIAVDNETVTQKKLVQAIASGVGNGLTKQLPHQINNYTANAWLRPSASLEDSLWVSREGLLKNMQKIKEEFKIYRGLDTIRLVIYGGSASGKSLYAKELSEYYKIPHIQIKELISHVAQMDTELGLLVKSTLASIKEQMTQEALVIFEAERKKKKVPKGQPEPVFDPSYIVPRLPDSVLIQVYKWRLDQNDAQNLGYILDGFPKTAEQAKELFFTEDSHNLKYAPKGVIHLDYTDEFLKEKAKSQDPARYAENLLIPRLANYRKHSEQLLLILKQFEVKRITQEEQQILQQIHEFITRNGPIAVLQDDPEQGPHFIEEIVQEAPAQVIVPATSQPKKKDALNKSINDSRISKQAGKLTEEQRQEAIRQQERELLDTRSQPLRQYLADNVVPYLTEGLIQICERQPDDPLAFLADYLEQKGIELQGPFAK